MKQEWKVLVIVNGVAMQTAYEWIRKSIQAATASCGREIDSRMFYLTTQSLLDWLSDNHLLILTQLEEKLVAEAQIHMSNSTIHKNFGRAMVYC